MTINDRVYGELEINEPIVVELINTPVMQRLKEIDMSGYFEPYFPGTAHNRFEHSVGVYWLLYKYGAPLEEQIAGLLHDVSHTAFSHCSDYMFSAERGKTQTYQDDTLEEYILKTDIPNILRKYGMNLNYILDDSHFPLKETKSPDLCADRLDYSLRGLIAFRLAEPEKIKKILAELKVDNNRWFFETPETAKEYAELFKYLNDTRYSGIESAMMLSSVGKYLKYALEKKYIEENDLYKTDKEVLNKIGQFFNGDPELQKLFDRMSHKVNAVDNPSNYDYEVYCKSRMIDPLCQTEKGIICLSDWYPEWKQIVEKNSKPKKYFLKWDK